MTTCIKSRIPKKDRDSDDEYDEDERLSLNTERAVPIPKLHSDLSKLSCFSSQSLSVSPFNSLENMISTFPEHCTLAINLPDIIRVQEKPESLQLVKDHLKSTFRYESIMPLLECMQSCVCDRVQLV
jgi:hypothetical protein